MLSSSRGQGNFWGLETSRPRPRTSKCVLEDVLEAKDVLEDSTSVEQHRYLALSQYSMSNLGFSVHFLLKLQLMISVFFHQLRSLQGKSNLPPFFDGPIIVALNRLDAYLWYLSEEMAFLFFSKQLAVNKNDQCRKEMLRYKPKFSLRLQKLSKVMTPEVKKCTKKKAYMDQIRL